MKIPKYAKIKCNTSDSMLHETNLQLGLLCIRLKQKIMEK